MNEIPTRETFQSLYTGKAPWDIGKPQPVFVGAADTVQGAVLDAGCGTGENALYFAQRGHPVVGIDFLDFPIREARRKATERGANVDFISMDALTLADFDRKFDSVIDCGLFHGFSDEQRSRYVEGLAHVTKPGGRLFLACFSDEEPGELGPRRVSKRELDEAFATLWTIESVTPTRFEVIREMKDAFSPGGPKAWFAIVKRSA
jgi:cyclopropane fatty-acyl-phospholipid synthase-like methyltransferase